MTHVQSVPDVAILEAVHEALDNGDRLALQGGPRPTHVAQHCELQPESARKRLDALVEQGTLVQVWGADTDQPGFPGRVGYLPAGHPDATSPFTLPTDQ
ncbi:hypothetical protein [Haloarcula sp. CGMCC 1.6347]|uniref:hypothetical protein n=1 Tax=Haloarcula sp. CGMCC 1.6347 TaxID=3111455 RepID=UPI00300EDAB4